jgi:hypothetical protein
MAKKTEEKEPPKTTYTIKDAIEIADEILKNGQEKKYNLGAFMHGLIFAQEFVIHSYQIPQQQIASIKRDCKKYFKDIDNAREQQSPKK